VFLGDLDRSTLAPEFKKEGGDWFATFNPKAKRVLDVSLVHTLVHGKLVVSFVRSPLTGITGLTACFPPLVLLLVFDFLRTESIWRWDALEKHRSMIRKLAPELGSVLS